MAVYKTSYCFPFMEAIDPRIGINPLDKNIKDGILYLNCKVKIQAKRQT